jgi:hypothetical protein
MKRKIAVIPAIAYSISISSKPFGGFREAPHQTEEHNHDSNVKQIQHDSPHLLTAALSRLHSQPLIHATASPDALPSVTRARVCLPAFATSVFLPPE